MDKTYSQVEQRAHAVYGTMDTLKKKIYHAGINEQTDDYEINAFFPKARKGHYLAEFKFELKRMVKKYSDCVELYYKLFRNFNGDLKNTTVVVSLPPELVQKETKIFAHGDPNTRLEFQNDSANALYKSKCIYTKNMLELRILNKQVDVFSPMSTVSGNSFEKIMLEEKSFIDTDIRTIRLRNTQGVLILVMILCSVITMVVLSKIVFARHGVRRMSDFSRQIPTLSPVVAWKLNDNYGFFSSSFGNSVAATILDLATKNVIQIEPYGDKDIKFILQNEINFGVEKKQKLKGKLRNLQKNNRPVREIVLTGRLE